MTPSTTPTPPCDVCGPFDIVNEDGRRVGMTTTPEQSKIVNEGDSLSCQRCGAIFVLRGRKLEREAKADPAAGATPDFFEANNEMYWERNHNDYSPVYALPEMYARRLMTELATERAAREAAEKRHEKEKAEAMNQLSHFDKVWAERDQLRSQLAEADKERDKVQARYNTFAFKAAGAMNETVDRTIKFKAELDALQDSLAKSMEEAAEARRERDIWIYNAKQLQKQVNEGEPERATLRAERDALRADSVPRKLVDELSKIL